MPTETLEDLKTDRRYMLGFAVGSLALLGASVASVVGAVTGKIGKEGYTGALGIPVFAKAAARTIGGTVSLTHEIRSRKISE